MPKNESFSSYLNKISFEEGLIAEIDFRYAHFESMQDWPLDNDKIKLFKYEDILGNEPDIMKEIFDFYELSWSGKQAGSFFANKFSAKKSSKSFKHIRNPSSGQWKNEFSKKVEEYFNQKHYSIIEKYGY